MAEDSSVQNTLKRLIEAEDQAREFLKTTQAQAEQTIAQAREQAKQSLDAARRETADSLRSRLEEAESKAAAGLKQRLEQADAEVGEIERRASQHFSEAVDMVVDWVTKGAGNRNANGKDE